MPTYVYLCDDCNKLAHSDDDVSDAAMFETRYGFSASNSEIYNATQCPRCKGHNCHKIITAPVHVRIKGGNWNDFYNDPDNKAAMKRERDLHVLQTDDPFAEHRTPEEKSDLIEKLKSSDIKKSNKLYFT